MAVPALRISLTNDAPINANGAYVLYWMIAHRRSRYHFGVQRAVELANEHGVGVVVLEALRVGYPWASDRLHRYIIDGMEDNAHSFEHPGVRYLSYVERVEGAGRGLLACLADDAVAVVTDEFPCFFLPKMVAAAGRKLPVRLEAVDTNGVMPLRSVPRAFARAVDFRRWLQKSSHEHLQTFPEAEPLSSLHHPTLPAVAERVFSDWSVCDRGAPSILLSELPIDHTVGVVEERGGENVARQMLDTFITRALPRYAEARNHPDDDVASGLSPALHFGHVSAHEIVRRVWDSEGFEPTNLPEKGRGSREGWWGLSPAAEGFLDQIITWRELGYAFAHHTEDHDSYDALPTWALRSLDEHSGDERETLYTFEELDQAKTHDDIWNAAQRQLRQTGRMHNYLRMLWGKRVITWTQSPREAAEILVELNNRYALDGRNPNSYSGIFWVFGRFDRAWGPERPVYGKIRYMTSDSTRRKLRLKKYLQEFGDTPQGSLL
ncbi:MAG: deoxyribodipyrimidine photo-lyase [Bradymonadia bacterium]|jgi:deoxyribodipyrimidine photo-lyase